MRYFNRITKWFLAVLLLVVLAGCVLTGPVPARKVADDFNLMLRYDRQTDTVRLTDSKNTVIASPGSDQVLINGRLVPLGGEVIYRGAEVFFPPSVKTCLKENLIR